MNNEIALLTTFNDVAIHVGGNDLISLTDLWKASGGPAARDPRHWLILPETKRFLAFQCRKLGVRKSDIVRTYTFAEKPNCRITDR